MSTACFLRERLITKSSREWITPYKKIRGKRPDLRHLQRFGSRAYVHKPKKTRQRTFESQALAEPLVGYCKGNA